MYKLFLRFCWQVSICIHSAHIATVPYVWQLYSISGIWWGLHTLLKFSWQEFSICTQRLADGSESECMWHFTVHMTLHSATRIIVRTALKKLFALQQLLLPRDYWIFYRSSKPYFTVCSSRAAAGTPSSLWYWASNRMHREADAGRLTVPFNSL